MGPRKPYNTSCESQFYGLQGGTVGFMQLLLVVKLQKGKHNQVLN